MKAFGSALLFTFVSSVAFSAPNECRPVVNCQAYCQHGEVVLIPDLVVSSGATAADAFELLQTKCQSLRKSEKEPVPFLVSVNGEGRVSGYPATLSSCN